MSFTVNGITTTNNQFIFYIPTPSSSPSNFGDSLSDGTIDDQGTPITFPNTTSTPKNYRVDLVLNFNGSGTYTITQI